MARNQREWLGISQDGEESARMARNQDPGCRKTNLAQKVVHPMYSLSVNFAIFGPTVGGGHRNFQKRPKMARNQPEWPRISQNAKESTRMAKNQLECQGTSQNGKESTRMARNQPEWQGISHHGQGLRLGFGD